MEVHVRSPCLAADDITQDGRERSAPGRRLFTWFSMVCATIVDADRHVSATAIPWTGRLTSTTTRATRSRHPLLWFSMVSDPWLDADRQPPRRAGLGTVPAIAGADTGLGVVAIPEIRRD